MIKMLSVDELVRYHGVAKIKMIDSFSLKKKNIYEKYYTCNILEDLGNHLVRISMPIEYGEVVPLPLDCHYEMKIVTKVGDYYTKGVVISRYKCEKGNVMEFKMTKPLSFVLPLNFPTIKTNIQTSYTLYNSTIKNLGNITALSLQQLSMETYVLLEEGSFVDIVFCLDGGENMVLSGEVKESVKINVQQYDNTIRLDKVDYYTSINIAKWMLDKNEVQEV